MSSEGHLSLFADWHGSPIDSHKHSAPPDSDCYGGPGHRDAHRDGYEHSHIDPGCDRYKYPYPNGHPDGYAYRDPYPRSLPSTARD